MRSYVVKWMSLRAAMAFRKWKYNVDDVKRFLNKEYDKVRERYYSEP